MSTTASMKQQIEAAPVSEQPSDMRIVSVDDVARRAYALYESREHKDGYDVEDWLQAERELLNPDSD